MIGKSVLDDQCGKVETVEFRCYYQHFRSPCFAERRPPWPKRVDVGTHTCLKYAGPVPWTQLKANVECVYGC